MLFLRKRISFITSWVTNIKTLLTHTRNEAGTSHLSSKTWNTTMPSSAVSDLLVILVYQWDKKNTSSWTRIRCNTHQRGRNGDWEPFRAWNEFSRPVSVAFDGPVEIRMVMWLDVACMNVQKQRLSKRPTLELSEHLWSASRHVTWKGWEQFSLRARQISGSSYNVKIIFRDSPCRQLSKYCSREAFHVSIGRNPLI